MELLGQLGIDWRLLAAQMVNFLILLGVLYKFLYRPVLAHLEERTVRIEKSLSEAKRIEVQAKQADEERVRFLAEARKEAQILLEKAAQDVETLRRKMTEDARREAERIVDSGKIQLEIHKEALLKDVRREVIGLVVSASRHVLGDVMDENIDASIAKSALRKAGRA